MSDYSTVEETAAAREMLHDLLGLSEGLSQWEVEFIEDVSRRDGPLTAGQVEKITEIYEERM